MPDWREWPGGVTNLNGFAMPLVRYDIDDYAVLGGPSSCSQGLALIKSVLGRVSNMLTLPSGEKLWPSFHFNFNDSIGKSLPSFRGGQLVQRNLGEI